MESDPERSYLHLEVEDLLRLAMLARADREALFRRNPSLGAISDRFLCTALCQGAALHFVDGTTGIKDFDVFSFFRESEVRRYPPRRRVEVDYGDPKFGISSDRPSFRGRRVDLMGRSIRADASADIKSALQGYLRERRTETAGALSQKAVILLEPETLAGTLVWNRGPV